MEHVSKILAEKRLLGADELALPICDECGGEGVLRCRACRGYGESPDGRRQCLDCGGTGDSDKCGACDGTGAGRCECGEPVLYHLVTIFGRRAVCDECSAAEVEPLNEIRILIDERDHARKQAAEAHVQVQGLKRELNFSENIRVQLRRDLDRLRTQRSEVA